MELINDVYTRIFIHLPFIDKLCLKATNRWCYSNLHITDLCYDLNLRQKMALTDTIIRQHPYVECLFAFDNPQITCHWRIKTVINRWNWKTFNQSLEKLPAEEERWIKLIHEQTAFYPYFCAIAYYRCRGDVVNSIMELTL